MTDTPTPPYFDIELFLLGSGESRLSGDEIDQCVSLWDQWAAHLSANAVTVQNRQYLAVWLAEAVEQAVDSAWAESPSKGFRLNALAQTLCMCAVHERVPEVEEAGCAPVPPPSPELAAALTAAGLPARAANGLELARRYAVVTRAPFGGGCEVCALIASCPRSGQAGDTMIEIG